MLGDFDFAPSQNHRVELSALAETRTVADAIRFVPVGDARLVAADAARFVANDAEEVHYIHTDRLGTPHRMTDNAGAVIWDASFTPYGREEAVTGPAALDIRFPGQVHDAETGLHYNYWRDYSPNTGRYVQSDPIGLAGGLNTYAYVGGNPMRFADPSGLETYRCTKPLDAFGGSGAKSGPDIAGNPFYHQYSCVIGSDGKVTCGGQDYSDVSDSIIGPPFSAPGKPSDDVFSAKLCELAQDDNQCFESCLIEEWSKPRPRYGIPFGTDCQEYDNDVHRLCRRKCSL